MLHRTFNMTDSVHMSVFLFVVLHHCIVDIACIYYLSIIVCNGNEQTLLRDLPVLDSPLLNTLSSGAGAEKPTKGGILC